jgi:hypothetical protein
MKLFSLRHSLALTVTLFVLGKNPLTVNKKEIMAQMIIKGKEMIRINPTNKTKIEYSTTEGRTWFVRYISSNSGDFNDLTDTGKEIIAMTTKGLYYSTTDGRSWFKRN